MYVPQGTTRAMQHNGLVPGHLAYAHTAAWTPETLVTERSADQMTRHHAKLRPHRIAWTSDMRPPGGRRG